MSEDKEEWVEAVLACGRLSVCRSSLSSRLMYVFALWALFQGGYSGAL